MHSKDSDQPGNPPSLISLHCALNGLLRRIQAFFIWTAKTLIRLGEAQADLTLRWAHNHIVGFVMLWLIFVKKMTTMIKATMVILQYSIVGFLNVVIKDKKSTGVSYEGERLSPMKKFSFIFRQH